jgi:hypothetical protein
MKKLGKNDLVKAPEKTDKSWRDSEITRSQIFASGTVQKWLELADKAFESDVPEPEAVSIAGEEIKTSVGPTMVKRARAKSA